MAARKPKASGVTAGNSWRNRIVGYGEENPEQLLANPKNWRIHPQAQQEALGELLDSVGWVGVAAIINQRTQFIVDGHLRVLLAISRGEKSIPVAYVDLTDEEEALVLASFDPISNAAAADSEKLNDLIAELDLEHGALDSLLASLFEEGQQTQLRDVEEDVGGEQGDGARQLGDRAAQIKPVLYADQVAVFERALRITGEINRGRALIQVCEFYLQNARSEETGQLDVLLEEVLAR